MTTSTVTPDQQEHQTGTAAISTTLRDRLQQFLAFASLIVIFVFFSLASENFLNYNNVTAILFSTVVIGTLALGTTFVIITGGIDLSIGTGMALCAVISGVLVVNAGLPVALGVLGAVLFGGLLGFINGVNVAILKLPPFIATLGMMSVARGTALVFTEGRPISGFDDSFRALATGSIGFVPAPVVVMILVYAVAHMVLTRTTFGRYVYAIGGNEEATRLSGVAVRFHKKLIYGTSGLISAVAAIVLTARLNSAQPIAGMMYELDAIAATVIGGTSLMGGEGTLAGTLVGALIMSVLRNGLNLLGVSSFLQQIVIGVVIVSAVLVDTMLKRHNRS